MPNLYQRENWQVSTIFLTHFWRQIWECALHSPWVPQWHRILIFHGRKQLGKRSLLGYFLFVSHSTKDVSWDQLWNQWPIVEYLSQGLLLREPKPRVCCISGQMEILSLVFHGWRSCWHSSCLTWHVGEPLLFGSEEECSQCVLLLYSFPLGNY